MNPRYLLFVDAYVTNGFNSLQAALTAGYSPRTAHMAGSRLMKNVEVQALITARTKPVLDKYGVTLDNTLKHLAAVGYQDSRDTGVWGMEGGKPYFRPHNSEDLTEMAALAVASMKMKAKYHPARTDAEGNLVEEEYYDVEIELKHHDKVQALIQIAKYLGILPTTGKVRINVDSRHQEMNVFDLKGFTKEEILELARMPLPEDYR